MNELEKMIKVIAETSPDTILIDAYKVFETINKSTTHEDGMKLVALLQTMNFMVANCFNPKSFSQLQYAIASRIILIDKKTRTPWWSSERTKLQDMVKILDLVYFMEIIEDEMYE